MPAMGSFLFDVPEPSDAFFRRSNWQAAYVLGTEGVPSFAQVSWEDRRLAIRQPSERSGKLVIACQLEGMGGRTLTTCSLRQKTTPYLLPLELARGSCHRARAQADTWRRAGLNLGDRFDDLLRQGTAEFIEAVGFVGDPAKASRASLRAVKTLEEASTELGQRYASQSIAFRRQREDRLGILVAAGLLPDPNGLSPDPKAYLDAFNAAALRVCWSDSESDSGRFDFAPLRDLAGWCREQGVRVIGGPLLDWRDRLLPDWLTLLEDDFESLSEAISQFVERTVLELRGSVHLWNCAAGLNTPGPLNLDDEQRIRLGLVALQAVRRCDPNTPAIVTFDQPFGEYLSSQREGISPLHFADVMARSGLGLAGLGLEFRFGYPRGATLPRSAVDLGELIDRWSALGMPLLVQLGVPGGEGVDPQALLTGYPPLASAGDLSPADEQRRIAQPLLQTLLAKHAVHAIVWDEWSDARRHLLPHAGLIAADGTRRPLWDDFRKTRAEILR